MGNCLQWLRSCWRTQQNPDYEQVHGVNALPVRIEDTADDADNDRGNEACDEGSEEPDRVQLVYDEPSHSTRKRKRLVQSEQLQQFAVDERATTSKKSMVPKSLKRAKVVPIHKSGVHRTHITDSSGLNTGQAKFYGQTSFYINNAKKENNQSKRAIVIFNSIKKMLQLRYKKDLMPLLPWMPSYVLRLSKLYVKLTLTPRGTFGENLQEKDIELNNIFDVNDDYGRRILVEGPPAYGKSTLALKLCQDWANGTEDYTKRFELAILIHLRNFRKKTFEEVLVDAGRVSWPKISDKEIEDLIMQNAGKTLLVLDGFDELPAGKRKLLFPLLSGDIMSEATVVVTARPGSYNTDNQATAVDSSASSYVHVRENTYFTSVFQKRIVVKGIQEHQQSEFLYKHLSEKFTKEQVDNLNAELSSRYDCKLFECPLFLLLAAILLIETNLTSHRNKTDLYKNLFNFIVQRGLLVLENFGEKVDLFTFNEENAPRYIDLLRRFGRMALNFVIRRELTFSAEQILCHFDEGDERILRLGFLTHKDSLDSIKQTCWYEPVHRTLIEFGASYYLYLLWKEGQIEDFQNHMKVLSDFLPDRHYYVESPVFTFLTGLMEKQTHFLFDTLKPFRLSYTHWFDSHYEPMLSELELTENVLDSVAPFFNSEWPINSERDTTFCRSLAHARIVGFGINNSLIHTVKWDVNSTATIPCNTKIPNIELHISDGSNFSYRLEGGNPECANLCCKLLGDEYTAMKDENWSELVTLIQSIQYETLSFDFTAFCCYTFLPILVQETRNDSFDNTAFQHIKCELQTAKPYLLQQLCQLLESVNVKEVKIVLRSSPGLDKALWNSSMQRIVQIEHLQVLSVENSDPTSFVLIDETVLRNGGQKVWKSVELEGFIDLKTAPDSQFQDITYGAAGETRYIKAIMNNVGVL